MSPEWHGCPTIVKEREFQMDPAGPPPTGEATRRTARIGTGSPRPGDAGPYDTDHEAARSGSRHSGSARRARRATFRVANQKTVAWWVHRKNQALKCVADHGTRRVSTRLCRCFNTPRPTR